jgi:hypothetical protein
MGLKGYRLWAMGQLDSNVQSPTALARLPRALQESGVKPALEAQHANLPLQRLDERRVGPLATVRRRYPPHPPAPAV